MNVSTLEKDVEAKRNTSNDDLFSFLLRIIRKIKKNPRHAGYNDNLSAIDKMIDDGIWYKIVADEMTPFFSSLSRLYNVKGTNFFSLQKFLRLNISWLPKHSKNPEFSRVFTPEQFRVVENLIDSLSKSHNFPITNLLIKELLRCYYHNLIYKPQPKLQFNCSTHYITKIKEVLS